jgi:hypothetical protein
MSQVAQNKGERIFFTFVTGICGLMDFMRYVLLGVLIAGLVGSVLGRDGSPAKTIPLPENYREWVWLSSGLGMSYSASSENPNPRFDNVFASPEAYKAFKVTGTWPAKTTLMLEIRNSASNSSINKAGHFQAERTDVEAHVKNESGQWAFYSFGNGGKTGTLIPKQADCYSCHEQHGAVDTTFVQFYPTLLEIAKAKGKVERQ